MISILYNEGVRCSYIQESLRDYGLKYFDKGAKPGIFLFAQGNKVILVVDELVFCLTERFFVPDIIEIASVHFFCRLFDRHDGMFTQKQFVVLLQHPA